MQKLIFTLCPKLLKRSQTKYTQISPLHLYSLLNSNIEFASSMFRGWGGGKEVLFTFIKKATICRLKICGIFTVYKNITTLKEPFFFQNIYSSEEIITFFPINIIQSQLEGPSHRQLLEHSAVRQTTVTSPEHLLPVDCSKILAVASIVCF